MDDKKPKATKIRVERHRKRKKIQNEGKENKIVV